MLKKLSIMTLVVLGCTIGGIMWLEHGMLDCGPGHGDVRWCKPR